MAAHGFRVFLICATVFWSLRPAAAETPDICGGKPVAAQIVEALDGASLKLSDGRVVRLANVIAPLPLDADRAAMQRSKDVLGEIANGKRATLYLSSEEKDRYGRISAQAVSVEDEVWLEAELLKRGSVRAFPAASEKCVKALLGFETVARSARTAIWNEAKFGVMDAQNEAALLAADGRFAVVEGTIRRVGEARRRLYLDFGRRFKEDFTIIVPDSVRKSLTGQGSDPKSWRGKRVRVRGILFSWGGPAMEINRAQAIELLD